MQGLLAGKNIVIMGVANERSLAWGITRSLHSAGANLIFTYRKERSLQKLSQLLMQDGIKSTLCVRCDVSDDRSIESAFSEINQHTTVIHGIVHSVAFAEKEELHGEYVDTSRDGYLLAQSISTYSLVAVAREGKKLMTEGGVLLHSHI